MTLLWYPFVFVLPPMVGLHVCMPFFPWRFCSALFKTKRFSTTHCYCPLHILFSLFLLVFPACFFFLISGSSILPHTVLLPAVLHVHLYILLTTTPVCFPVFILRCNTLPLQVYLSCSVPWVPALISFFWGMIIHISLTLYLYAFS